LIYSKESKGFSLIEVLVALVILSISLLALAGLMVTTTRNNASGGHLTEAATLAQDKLERLRLLPLGTIANNFQPNTWYPINPLDDPLPFVSSGITYTRKWSYTAPNTTLDIITITVSWTDTTPHSITMVSTIPL
jgi:prepilin-type N-terminal cleavage/methylation domain-containing protein